ncbi:MAG: carbohydrate kinase family protein [Candidatus Thorarchaeota archaeon]
MDFSSLIAFLQEEHSYHRPVILPDFFLDHFVITGGFEDFISDLRNLAEQGGGNLLGTNQFVRKGGNSINTASVLFSLGLDPCPIITSDSHGANLLQSLTPKGFDLSHVHLDGRLSSTVSIETDYKGRRVNLMVSDSGSASRFSFSQLTESDLLAIRESSIVALVNLNHNKDAVALARDLFTYVKANSDALTFMDMGDPSWNKDIIEPLAKNVLSEGLVDFLSVNENEAAWFAWGLSNRDSTWRNQVADPSTWLKTANFVSHETGVRVGLHTPVYSASLLQDDVVGVPAFDVESKIICGAGDSWNAGVILGLISQLSIYNQLLLANAIAALYVSSDTVQHPSNQDVLEFLKGSPRIQCESNKFLKEY